MGIYIDIYGGAWTSWPVGLMLLGRCALPPALAISSTFRFSLSRRLGFRYGAGFCFFEVGVGVWDLGPVLYVAK